MSWPNIDQYVSTTTRLRRKTTLHFKRKNTSSVVFFTPCAYRFGMVVSDIINLSGSKKTKFTLRFPEFIKC